MNEEYLIELYNSLSSFDKTFANDVSLEKFKASMTQDKSYAAQIYENISSIDKTFSSDVSIDAFMKAISKQEEPVVKKKDTMALSSGVGSSAYPTFKEDRFQSSSDNARLAPSYLGGLQVKQGQGAEQLAVKKQAEKKRSADMEALKKEEAQKKIEIEGVETAQRNKLWADPNFAAKLNLIDSKFVGQNDTEVLPVLREKFAQYGFIFEQSNFDGMGDNIVVKNRDGSKQIVIDLDAWTDAGEVAESKKLRDFIKENSTLADERSVVDDAISKAIRAKQLRKKGRVNPDGTISTVKFESANIDGKEVVYPTLFPRDSNGDYGTSADWWDELSGMDAYKRALERNEVFTFDNAEEARKFAEGSWKDVSNVDAEGQIFFKEKGKDYIQEKKRYDEYVSVRDQIDFIEGMPSRVGMDKDVKKYPSLFVNGILRDDAKTVLADLKKKEAELYEVVMDEDAQKLREEWDVELSKRQLDAAKRAVVQNTEAKQTLEQIKVQSYKTFGVAPEQLAAIKVNTPEEQAMANGLLKSYVDAQAVKQHAADKYEIAKTYYDAKVNKSISKDLSDNLAAVSDEISTGYSRGKAQEVILMASLGIEYDVNDPELRKKAAEQLVKLSTEEGETQSRVLARYAQATGGKEVWDVIKNDPLELFGAWAFGSIAQLLPYGSKIVSATTLAGIGTGIGAGLAGGPLAEVTVPGGAITGGAYGFATGMGLASLAMEYGNEMIDAISTMGYDITDPESVEQALLDEEVWALGKERGLKRGIPIALIDFASAGTVGKVIKVGSVAGIGTRIAANLGERLAIDPAFEALGEAAAQMTVGDDIDYKEIIAEAGGGIGNNSSYVAINTLKNARNKNNVDLASKLTNIDFISRETTSDKRISDWANNMQQLGKIDADQNQRIQLNVGLRAEARNLLGVGGKSKYSGEVEARTMTLLAAREELSSTPNRKSVFSNKISEINAELEEIATTKTVRPAEEQTLLAGTGVLGAAEQASGTDIRGGLGSYQIGKKKVTKEEFLKAINKMSIEDLRKFNGKVENDDEVLNMVVEKLAPLQEQGQQQQTVLSEDGTLVVKPATEVTAEATPEVVDITAQLQPQLDATTDEGQALISEVSDLETMLSQPEGKVEFRLKTEGEVAPAADEVEATIRAINALPTANAATVVSSKTQGIDIDAKELGTRTTKPPKTVSLDVIKGIPTIFTISDQLRTGSTVNPNTGNTIDNLMGGLGYSLVEDAAWANTTEDEAINLEKKALTVYNENKFKARHSILNNKSICHYSVHTSWF